MSFPSTHFSTYQDSLNYTSHYEETRPPPYASMDLGITHCLPPAFQLLIVYFWHPLFIKVFCTEFHCSAFLTSGCLHALKITGKDRVSVFGRYQRQSNRKSTFQELKLKKVYARLSNFADGKSICVALLTLDNPCVETTSSSNHYHSELTSSSRCWTFSSTAFISSSCTWFFINCLELLLMEISSSSSFSKFA